MVTDKGYQIPCSIAVDLMGGDRDEEDLIRGCLLSLQEFPQLSITLIATDSVCQHYNHFFVQPIRQRINWLPASQIVEMSDAPISVFRNKRDSSMAIAMQLVKDKLVQGCVSTGNTGALMALAQLILRPLSGVDRPALVQAVPHRTKKAIAMLDLGANVLCSSIHLQQFALMGHLWAKIVLGRKAPKTKLLNIGQEPCKGYDQIRQAAALLEQDKNLDYGGYIEGHQIFFDDADVVVSEGFAGNIALKTMEGSAHFMIDKIKKAYKSSYWRTFLGYLTMPMWRELQTISDPRRRNGACLLGVRGVVVKSHGSADAFAFSQAVNQTYRACCMNLPEKIEQLMLQNQAMIA